MRSERQRPQVFAAGAGQEARRAEADVTAARSSARVSAAEIPHRDGCGCATVSWSTQSRDSDATRWRNGVMNAELDAMRG